MSMILCGVVNDSNIFCSCFSSKMIQNQSEVLSLNLIVESSNLSYTHFMFSSDGTTEKLRS